MTHYDFSLNTRLEKHKPKRSPVESAAENISAQDRAGQSTAYGNVNATDANLSGKTTDTPYYRSLLATSTDATSNAYQSAKSASAARANAAGFGNTQPVAQGGQSELEAREAGAMSELPAKAIESTVPLQLRAAEQQLSEGGELGREGEGYFTGGAVPLEEEYQKRNSAFQQKLWDIGAGAAQGATAGLA